MKKAIKISAVLVALVVLAAMAFVFTSSAAEATANTAAELIENLAKTEETIVKLGADITLGTDAINVGGKIVLDLNGHTITSATTGALFTQTGVINPIEFVIKDSVGGGAIIAPDATLLGDGFGGTVKIEGGTFIITKFANPVSGKKLTVTVAQSENDKTGTWISFDPNSCTVLGYKGYEIASLKGSDKEYLLEGKTPADARATYYVRPEEYTITYVIPGNTDNTKNEEKNTTFTIWDEVKLFEATAEGYLFQGWFESNNDGETKFESSEDGSVISIAKSTAFHSIELVGKFVPETYTVTYGGVEGATHNNQGTFTVELPNLKLTDATKKGYTFLGWYTEANGQGERVTQIECSKTTENVTVYAHFEAIEYSITYITYGGTPVAGQTLVEKYTIEDTLTFAELTKPGYTFTAWYTVVEPTADDQPKTGVTAGEIGNITVYAQYEKVEYKITYGADERIDEELTEANGFVGTYTVETETFTLKHPQLKPGYTFLGWKDETGKIVTAVTVGSIGDLNLTPEIKATIYKIFYNFGTGVQNSDVNNDLNAHSWSNFLGGQSPALVGATRAHYEFLGWSYTNPEDSEVQYLAYDEATKTWTIPATTYENVTVYAVWVEAEYEISYDIDGYKYKILLNEDGTPALDDNGNVQYVDAEGNVTDDKTKMVKVDDDFGESEATISADKPTTYTYFDSVTIPNPTRPGYIFVRWYDEITETYLEPDANGVVTIAAGTRSGDLSLVAEWEVAKYKVTIKYQFNDDYYGVNADVLKTNANFKDEGRTFYEAWLDKEVVYGTPIYHEVNFRILNGFVPEKWLVDETMGAEDTTIIVYFEPVVRSTEFKDGQLVITYHDNTQKTIDVESVTGVKYESGKVVYVDKDGNSTVVAATHADISKAIEDLNLDALKSDIQQNKDDIQNILGQLPDFVNKADFDALKTSVADLQAQIDALSGKDTTYLVLIIIVAIISVAAAAGVVFLFVKKN